MKGLRAQELLLLGVVVPLWLVCFGLFVHEGLRGGPVQTHLLVGPPDGPGAHPEVVRYRPGYAPSAGGVRPGVSRPQGGILRAVMRELDAGSSRPLPHSGAIQRSRPRTGAANSRMLHPVSQDPS